MITKEDLQLFGLAPIEAQMYAYLLKHGAASATEISKVVEVGRTNVYEYVKNLEQKGLVKQIEKHNKLYFEIESPLKLKRLGEKKISENRNLTNLMEEIVPKLATEYYKQQELPLITYLSGQKDYEEFFNGLYLQGATTEIFYFISDLKDYEAPEPKYRFAIQNKGLFTHIYVNQAEGINDLVKNEEREMRETKIINIPINKDIIISEDKVVIGKTRKDEFIVMLIKDFEFASLLKGLIKFIS